MLFSLAACKKDEDPAGTYITAEEKTAIVNELGKVYMEISVKDYGKITMELYPEIAPVTVKNFVKLVSEDFYSGIIFHRVIKDFMIQGGDPEETAAAAAPIRSTENIPKTALKIISPTHAAWFPWQDLATITTPHPASSSSATQTPPISTVSMPHSVR